MGNGLAGEGIAERCNVLVNHRSRVNNRDVAVTDHVGTRAIKRETRMGCAPSFGEPVGIRFQALRTQTRTRKHKGLLRP